MIQSELYSDIEIVGSMKNKNHEVLIEQLKNDNNKYDEFKQYFYYHPC